MNLTAIFRGVAVERGIFRHTTCVHIRIPGAEDLIDDAGLRDELGATNPNVPGLVAMVADRVAFRIHCLESGKAFTCSVIDRDKRPRLGSSPAKTMDDSHSRFIVDSRREIVDWITTPSLHRPDMLGEGWRRLFMTRTTNGRTEVAWGLASKGDTCILKRRSVERLQDAIRSIFSGECSAWCVASGLGQQTGAGLLEGSIV